MLGKRKIGPALPPGRVKAGPFLRLPSPGEDKEGRRATEENLSKTLSGGYVYMIFPRLVR
jgi:hypothetical protein